MTPLRQSRWTTTFVVAVVMFAWLGASNHCALAAIEGAKKSGHICCHETESGKQQAPKSAQCCEAFNVPLPDHVVAPVAHLHELQPAWIEVSVVWTANHAVDCLEFCNTGPPFAPGFAETVLNRSLLAHAPPLFVA